MMIESEMVVNDLMTHDTKKTQIAPSVTNRHIHI